MKPSRLFLPVALLAICISFASAEAPPERSAKAKSIFDGATIEGWESPAAQLWSVKDGCLTGGDGKNIPYNDFLCTKSSYSNFILHLKIKLTGDPKTGFINSGIQIRTKRNPTGHEVCGYQCDYGEPAWYGAIYDEGRRNRLMMKSDMDALRSVIKLWDWNDYVIKADGGRIKTWINGVQGVDYEEKDPDIASDGIIGIQVHGGGNTIVQVKDVFIEELPPSANAITWEMLGGVEGQRAKLKPQPAPAKPVKKAVDPTPKPLAGWEGDMKIWRVEEGSAVTCEIPAGQPLAKDESLVWKGEVNDFDLTFEYRLTGEPGAGMGIQYRSHRLPDGTSAGYRAGLDDGTLHLGQISEEHGRALEVASPLTPHLLAERGSRVSYAPDGRRWADQLSPPDSFRFIAKAGDWNTYKIHASASHVEVWVNGTLFSALDDHQAGVARFGGQLALVMPKGVAPLKVEFRNMQLADLGATEPTVYREKIVPQQTFDGPGIKPLGADGKPLNLDFETGTLEGWKVEGDAWEGQPVKGDTVATRHRGNSNHEGQFWIGGYEKIGDKGTGRLTSSSFEVTHPWASFLIGGGKDPKAARVEVVDEASGNVIHSASGLDVENMRREFVNLKAYAGKRIFVRLVDEGTQGWGHVNFDDFVFHDKAPSPAAAAAASVNPDDHTTHQKTSPVLWQLQPNPAKPTAVANAEAQHLVAGMMLTSGFQAELIAAEPEVKQPIAMAIDERGRLWVAEAYSYPKKQPEEKAKDRILIFEDVDGDGTYKKRTVFYEGLNLVSGMEVGFGGVWIGAAPEFMFIPKDADDHAGKPQVLLDGWGYQDTHETLNSFCWGPDGWLYGNQGVFTKSLIGKPGTPDGKRIELHSGVWRYHPIRHEFEIFAHGGSNQWGLDFNEAGHLFMTHCRSFWGGGGTSHVIRNGHFWNQANNGFAPFISNTGPDFAPDLKNFLPAAARYDSGEGGAGKPGSGAIYGGHSHVGTMIYLGDNWPEIYRNHLFTHNLFGQQMNHQENVRSGSGYETLHAGYDLMFTPDPRYVAIDLQTGPDGAVYVIDWCDLQHCHNPAEEKWDRTNGRIYRISWASTYHPVKVNLGTLSDIELVKLQTHHNDWYPRAARQLLQERAVTRKIDEPAVQALNQLAADSPNYAHVLRALWTLHVIGTLDEAKITAALHHADDRVRAWAIQLATDGKLLISGDALIQLAIHDTSPTVRLALASALPVLPSQTCWDVGAALAAHGEDATDRFLPKMIWFGLAPVVTQDLPRALALAEKTSLPSLADSICWYVARQPQGRDLLVTQLPSSPDASVRTLKLMAFALKDEAAVPMPASWPQAQTRFSNASDAALTKATEQIAALFGDKSVLTKMRGILSDEKSPKDERKAAFDLLKRSGDPEATPIFARLLDVPEFRTAVIPLLSRSADPAVAEALMQRFEKLDPADRSAALAALTSRVQLALPLLHAVETNHFDRKYLSALQVGQMRNLHNPEVDRLLDQGWGKLSESSAATKATIGRLKKAYSEAPLWAYDANAGHETFNQICAVCHALNGVGGKLGPDLAGSWRNGLDYFLENIVDPNAVVGENYQLHILTKKDGSIVSGLLDQESDTAITLRTLTGPVIAAKSDITQHQKLAQSLMPPGLLESMPERKALELLKFLTSKQ